MFKAERVGIRLEPELRQKLEQLIATGKFKTLSELVRAALKEFLKHLESDT